MNRSDINDFLTSPDLVANASSDEMRRLIEAYPYCEMLYWIYLRALYIKDDAIFEDELIRYGMHISNRRLFYNYLTYENIVEENKLTPTSETTIVLPVQTPDYFVLEQNPTQKQSLQQLAEQLKAARLARQKSKDATHCVPQTETQHTSSTPKQPTTIPSQTINQSQKTEEYAKKLIKEQKYLEAIKILRAISLNNPKKVLTLHFKLNSWKQ